MSKFIPHNQESPYQQIVYGGLSTKSSVERSLCARTPSFVVLATLLLPFTIADSGSPSLSTSITCPTLTSIFPMASDFPSSPPQSALCISSLSSSPLRTAEICVVTPVFLRETLPVPYPNLSSLFVTMVELLLAVEDVVEGSLDVTQWRTRTEKRMSALQHMRHIQAASPLR